MSNSCQPGALLMAPGVQPPGAGKAGVDIQAGVVKGMHTAGYQLEEARLQDADCRGH